MPPKPRTVYGTRKTGPIWTRPEKQRLKDKVNSVEEAVQQYRTDNKALRNNNEALRNDNDLQQVDINNLKSDFNNFQAQWAEIKLVSVNDRTEHGATKT